MWGYCDDMTSVLQRRTHPPVHLWSCARPKHPREDDASWFYRFFIASNCFYIVSNSNIIYLVAVKIPAIHYMFMYGRRAHVYPCQFDNNVNPAAVQYRCTEEVSNVQP